MKILLPVFLGGWVLLMTSCAVSKNYDPQQKIPAADLRSDFTLLQNILERKHPSLYWYTSRDSMDFYFRHYYKAITDSMTEHQFAWHILAPLIDKIHCGHTSVSLSKQYAKFLRGKRIPSFPLYLKIWNDTMAVMANLNQKDSIFKRGTIVTAVNGVKVTPLLKQMFAYLPEDGYANNINYIRLSANFPYYHRNIYGTYKDYQVRYLDPQGKEKTTRLPVFIPTRDTTKKKRDSLPREQRVKRTRSKKLLDHRSFRIDSSRQFAVMTINTFSKGKLRPFFRRSFRELEKNKIDRLILDIRSNGGGRVGLSTLLTKYISRTPFKVADSLYAVAKNLGPYTRYIKGSFANNIEMVLISHKKSDGKYHIRHLEKKLYKPKKRYHYYGKVYTLINGPTFSAATLFTNVIKGQEGISIIGEETGGGWHGNSGIMIPDITLPKTKTRVRLPLFRLVQYNHVPKTGSGIVPDIYVGTSYPALLKGVDHKMEVVKKMILEQENKTAQKK